MKYPTTATILTSLFLITGCTGSPTAATANDSPLAKMDKTAWAQAGLMEDPATGLITRAPGAEPTAAQRNQIDNMRYGMFIHFGINTFVDQEWTDGSVPIEKYAPKEIAAEEWVLAAKNAGMSHVVLICKHHDGFCLWPTKRDDVKYSVAHSSNKTDVVKAVSEACKKHGVRFAVYYSLWDRRWDAKNAELIKRDPAAANKAYTDYMISQLKELMTNYGPVTELWFDGSWARKTNDNAKTPQTGRWSWDLDLVYDAVKRLQPQCQISTNWTIGHPGYNRQVMLPPGNQAEGFPIQYFPSDFRLGDPFLPKTPDPKVFTRNGEKFYLPFESTVCMNKNWFWSAGDKTIKSVDELEKLYRTATAQDNTLLLNCPPGRDGRMRPENVARLAELRERLGLKVGGPFPPRAQKNEQGQTLGKK